MKLKITVIRFEVVDGKKKAKSFTFEKDPKEYAQLKTAATVQRKIEEYIAQSGIFKQDEMKDLNYNFDKENSMKNFLREWRKEVSPNDPESRVTPQKVTRLAKNEVFVFESNKEGEHKDGTALTAVKKFGAVKGEGNGLHGSSYAIPLMSDIRVMSEYVEEFCDFAKAHPEKHFLVTEVGCGNEGYSPSEVAPMFEKCRNLKNVSLPNSFWAKIRRL